jgi:hypothetical protein
MIKRIVPVIGTNSLLLCDTVQGYRMFSRHLRVAYE